MSYEQGLRRLQKGSKLGDQEPIAPRVKSRGLVSPISTPVTQDDSDPLARLSSFTDMIMATGEEVRGKPKLS